MERTVSTQLYALLGGFVSGGGAALLWEGYAALRSRLRGGGRWLADLSAGMLLLAWWLALAMACGEEGRAYPLLAILGGWLLFHRCLSEPLWGAINREGRPAEKGVSEKTSFHSGEKRKKCRFFNGKNSLQMRKNHIK